MTSRSKKKNIVYKLKDLLVLSINPSNASQCEDLRICYNLVAVAQFLVELCKVCSIFLWAHKYPWTLILTHFKIQKWPSLITEKLVPAHHVGRDTRSKNNLFLWKPNTTRKF